MTLIHTKDICGICHGARGWWQPNQSISGGEWVQCNACGSEHYIGRHRA